MQDVLFVFQVLDRWLFAHYLCSANWERRGAAATGWPGNYHAPDGCMDSTDEQFCDLCAAMVTVPRDAPEVSCEGTGMRAAQRSRRGHVRAVVVSVKRRRTVACPFSVNFRSL